MTPKWIRLLACAAAPALLTPPAAGEEDGATRPPLAWDQEKVAGIAESLAASIAGVREAFRREPPPNIASGQSRARFRLLDVLRRIESESRHLADELAAGRGHDETLPVFENLGLLVSRAQVERRRVFVESTTLSRVDEARGYLEALDAYYDRGAGGEEA